MGIWWLRRRRVRRYRALSAVTDAGAPISPGVLLVAVVALVGGGAGIRRLAQRRRAGLPPG